MRFTVVMLIASLWSLAAHAPTLPPPTVELAEPPQSLVDITGPSPDCLCWLRYTGPDGQTAMVHIRPVGTILHVCTGDELGLCKNGPSGTRDP
jgi:hypothetical protein